MQEYVAPTPAKGIPHPLVEGAVGIERMLYHASNHEQKALVALCGFVGLRIGEALAIDIYDFDLHDMLLRVRGKGDKTRVVPVSDRAWSVICPAYLDAAVRPDKRIVRYQDRSARKCVTTLGKKANLSRSISSHDLRATFATEVYNHTKDQRTTQELLGHASGSTTEIYIGVSMSNMKNAVDF